MKNKKYLSVSLVLLIFCNVTVAIAAQPEITVNKKLLVLLVSFSMPRQSLIADLRLAEKAGVSIAFRGLVDNSFPKTTQKIAEIIQESGIKAGVQIDPQAFQNYHIESVPVLIAQSLEGSFDKVSGDVSLAVALQEIVNKGDAGAVVANSALEKLKENHRV